MRVAIHEVVDKADDVIFRCTLNGSAADRWLEVPAWMFDRTRCLDPPRLTASPFVSMDALSALSDLLLQAPAWQDLPEGTRATLTDLMTRLILEHALISCAPLRTEVSHDH